MKPHKISTQIRQWIEKMEIRIGWMSWMSWNFVRFLEIIFQTDAENFSSLSWKTKKNIIQALVSRETKRVPSDGVCCPNFQWRFWWVHLEYTVRKMYICNCLASMPTVVDKVNMSIFDLIMKIMKSWQCEFSWLCFTELYNYWHAIMSAYVTFV